MSGDIGPAIAKTTTAGPKSDSVLPGFRKINDVAYVYEPSTEGAPASAPEIIILCTWMDAAVKHIAKYAKVYTTQYPDSLLLLIRSDVSELTWRSTSQQIQRMEPAASVLTNCIARGKSSTQSPRVLLHVFSNGGSWQACSLAKAYKKLHNEEAILPISAVVVDSAPSLLHAGRAHTAMTTGLPKSAIIQTVGSVFFWGIIGMIWLVDTLGLQENPLLAMRAMLNDTSEPFLRRDIPRVYIFSKTDKLVPDEDVILHASHARSKLELEGVDNAEDIIKLEEFEGSNHVAHMMLDPKRYWKIVEDTWKRASAYH